MARTKKSKHVLGEALGAKFGKAKASITAEYRGMSAESLRQLRIDMRQAGSEFRIVHNRVAKKSIESASPESTPLNPKLRGPIGVAYMYGDVAAGTKALLGFAKTNDKLVVTGGVMEGKALSKDQLQALSELPSKEVLLAQIIGTLVAPHRGLLHVMNGVSSKLVRVISAIKDTKS